MRKIPLKYDILSEVNRNYVRETILEHGPVSKPEITSITKLSLPTVNKIVDTLCVDEDVLVHSIGNSSGGRRPNLYVVNENSGYVCIVFIHGSQIKANLCSITGTVLISEALAFDTFEDIDIPGIIIDIIHSFFKSYDIMNLKIIGVGIPGVVASDGVISDVPTITALEGVNLKKEIEKHFAVPITVENDANMSALGAAAKHKEYKNIVYTYIGTGIGMGIVFDGHLYKGTTFLAGEVGKMVTDKYAKNKNMLTYEVLGILKEILPKGEILRKEESGNLFDSSNSDVKVNRLAQLSTLLIINTFCFLDPDVVFLDGDLICEPLVTYIKSGLIEYFGESYAGKVKVISDEDTGTVGITQYCLSKINKNPILIKQTEEIWT